MGIGSTSQTVSYYCTVPQLKAKQSFYQIVSKMSRATTTPQIFKDVIGAATNNKRAARAARTLEKFLQNNNVKYTIL